MKLAWYITQNIHKKLFMNEWTNEQIKAKTLLLANGSMNIELEGQNSQKETTK